MATRLASAPAETVTITSTPGILGGMPCVAGTRVPAETILACINAGETVFDIVNAYPHLPFGAIEAVVDWAQANGRSVQLPVRRMRDAFPRRPLPRP